MSPDHGTGVRYFGVIMSSLELSQRIREQKLALRVAKLKYRGVSYIQNNNYYGTTIQKNDSQRYEANA